MVQRETKGASITLQVTLREEEPMGPARRRVRLAEHVCTFPTHSAMPHVPTMVCVLQANSLQPCPLH